MRSDTIIKTEGMLALRNALGLVEAEKFILLIKQDHFDYTEWQTHLWEEKSVDELFNAANERKEKEE
jgi:hypothetical protein